MSYTENGSQTMFSGCFMLVFISVLHLHNVTLAKPPVSVMDVPKTK